MVTKIFYIDFIKNIDYLCLSIVLGQLLYRASPNIFIMVIAMPSLQGEHVNNHLGKKNRR